MTTTHAIIAAAIMAVAVLLGARTTTEGGAWNVLATFPLKPIQIP
jgi:hypothetical protein